MRFGSLWNVCHHEPQSNQKQLPPPPNKQTTSKTNINKQKDLTYLRWWLFKSNKNKEQQLLHLWSSKLVALMTEDIPLIEMLPFAAIKIQKVRQSIFSVVFFSNFFLSGFWVNLCFQPTWRFVSSHRGWDKCLILNLLFLINDILYYIMYIGKQNFPRLVGLLWLGRNFFIIVCV